MFSVGEIDVIFAGVKAVLKFGFGIQNLVTQKVVQDKVILPRPKKETGWLVVEDYFQNEGKNLVRPGGPYHRPWQDKDVPETAEESIQSLIEAYEGILGAKSIIKVFKNSPEFQNIFAHINEHEQYATIAALFKVEEKKKDKLFTKIFDLTLSVVKENAPLFAENNPALSRAITTFLQVFPTDVTALSKDEIFKGLLDATLKTAANNSSLFLGDNKFGSVMKAVLNHASKNITVATKGNYLKELLQATIDGVFETTGLWMNKVILQDIITSVLDVVSVNLRQDSVFRTQTLTDILQITLDSISREASLIVGEENLASMVLSSVLQVANQDPSKLLNPNKALFSDILKISLETIGKNSAVFLQKKDIVSRVLKEVLQAVGENPDAAISGELFKQLFLTSLTETLRNLQLMLGHRPIRKPGKAGRPHEVAPSSDFLSDILSQTVKSILKALSGAVAQFITEDQKTQVTQLAMNMVARNSAIFERYPHLLADTLVTTLEAVYRGSNRLVAGALLEDTVRLALTTVAKNPSLYDQEKLLLPGVLDSLFQTAVENTSTLIRGDLLIDFVQAALKIVSTRPNAFLSDNKLLSRTLALTLPILSEKSEDFLTGENMVRTFTLVLEAVSKEPDLIRKKDFRAFVIDSMKG
jgi:hypothetical protein